MAEAKIAMMRLEWGTVAAFGEKKNDNDDVMTRRCFEGGVVM